METVAVTSKGRRQMESKYMDPETWISQRAESNEGPTVYEFTQAFPDVPYNTAKTIFSTLEKEGLIFRTDMFTGGFRVYTMNEPPINVNASEESRLYHDFLDWLAEETFKPFNGSPVSVERMDVILFHRAYKAMKELHPSLIERQMARVFFVIRDKLLKAPKKLLHTWDFVQSFEDMDEFDEFMTDFASYSEHLVALKNVKERDLELWLKKDYERLVANEIGVFRARKEETPKTVEKKETPVSVPTQTLAEVMTPKEDCVLVPQGIDQVEIKILDEQEKENPDLVKKIDPPQPKAPLVQETSTSQELTLLDRLLEESTQINANPKAIRRVQAIGSFLSELGQGLDRVGKTLNAFGNVLDAWQDEDIGKTLSKDQE